MPANFQYDLILSHNPQDKPRVRRLAQKLRDAGLRVWFDEWAVEPGEDATRATERGLAASRVLVLCLSPAALGADWVTLERSTVPFRDPADPDRCFVPLLLADCDLPDTLWRYRYVDFRKETRPAFDELLAVCRSSCGGVCRDPTPGRGVVTPSPAFGRQAAAGRRLIRRSVVQLEW